MSRFDYSPLQSSAARLIEKFGAEYRFERQRQMSYDPETGKPVQRSGYYTANAVVSSFKEYERFTSGSLRSGEIVQEDDVILLAESGSYQIGDLVTYNCENYRLQDIKTIQGSQQKLAYYLHLRK